MLQIRCIEFLPSPVGQHLEQFVGLATVQRHLEALAHDSSMHPVTASRQICWDLDVSCVEQA
eukprot:2174718-Pyramimonas_sp.AAC.1